MARRGDELRDHILWVAKGLFLELGFERTSMDAIAGAAGASKRTLYAYFENKETLYLAVIAFVRDLFLERLRTPADHASDPEKAVVLFSARFLDLLLFDKTILMCRLCIAEASRFPEGAAQYFDAVFTTGQERLAGYLKESFGLTAKASAEAAQTLLGRVIHPRFERALFGLDALRADVDATDVDLKPIRRAVAELLASLRASPRPRRPRKQL